MLKKISILSLLLCLLLSLVSCENHQKQQELDERVHNLADITNFLKKSEEVHLNVIYNHKTQYIDMEDTIYNILVNVEYYEEPNVSNLGTKSSIHLLYDGCDHLLYFYPEQYIVGSFYMINAIFSGAEAERYYKVNETDFNTLYEKLEYCVANPNVEEKE